PPHAVEAETEPRRQRGGHRDHEQDAVHVRPRTTVPLAGCRTVLAPVLVGVLAHRAGIGRRDDRTGSEQTTAQGQQNQQTFHDETPDPWDGLSIRPGEGHNLATDGPGSPPDKGNYPGQWYSIP